MTDVEVEIDGKRKNMNKFTELGIEVKGVLEKDYKSQWEESSITKFLKDTYHKYVVAESIEQKEKKVREEVIDFRDEMKAFLDLTGRK